MIMKTNKIIPTAQATTKPMASGRMTQFGGGKVWNSTDTVRCWYVVTVRMKYAGVGAHFHAFQGHMNTMRLEASANKAIPVRPGQVPGAPGG